MKLVECVVVDNYELEVPKTLEELLMSCEVHCVAGCCGLDAFEFTREQVLEWLLQHPFQGDTVREQVDKLIDQLRVIPEPEVACMMLNTWWSREDAVKFFQSIRESLEHGL